MTSKNFKPGQTAPVSAQYGVYGPRGGYKGEITSTKGNTLPPSERPGYVYRPVDPVKNGSGKSR